MNSMNLYIYTSDDEFPLGAICAGSFFLLLLLRASSFLRPAALIFPNTVVLSGELEVVGVGRNLRWKFSKSLI
ncbi:unnamed protein product [Cuscuta campestris]|uniref:Uncharacterized protein n=1 Tax=Cuscuta campestris TaxID=132261 RepID=A0A484K5Q2_9ASTE|nr:unnamed protein product [Cuscuta campestris]